VGDNPGDYDIALGGSDLFERAKQLGIGLRGGGSRTGPLTEEQLDELGLSDLTDELTDQAGRDVHFMIFENIDTATSRSPSIAAPDSGAAQKYYTEQAQAASKDEAQLAEAEAQAEAEAESEAEAEAESEAEAEAFAEAEAMMMAEDE
jgi:hypothetical protein